MVEGVSLVVGMRSGGASVGEVRVLVVDICGARLTGLRMQRLT